MSKIFQVDESELRKLLLESFHYMSLHRALEAIQHIENYCNFRITKFGTPESPKVHGEADAFQDIKKLIEEMTAYYEHPQRSMDTEQLNRIIKQAQRKHNKRCKEKLKLAA